MSRASEITFILILLQASIGFVDASGMFDQHYVTIPSNNASYTIERLLPGEKQLVEYELIANNDMCPGRADIACCSF